MSLCKIEYVKINFNQQNFLLPPQCQNHLKALLYPYQGLNHVSDKKIDENTKYLGRINCD